YIEEALKISRELNDKSAIAAALNRLGDLARTQGNFAVAEIHFHESVAILRELGNKTALSNSINNLAAVTFANGDYATARGLFAEALMVAQEFGDKIVVAHALDGFAALAVEFDDSQNAAKLAGAAEEIQRAIGFQIEPAERRFRECYLTQLRRKAPEAALEGAFEEGRKLGVAKAVGLALSFLTREARRSGADVDPYATSAGRTS